MESIWILVVVSAFVAGTLMIGTMDSAEAQEFNVDSFFDIFYEINLNPDKCDSDTLLPKVGRDLLDAPCVDPLDTGNEFVVDSFFDVFYDIEFQVDSFFDVFFDVTVDPDGTEVRNTIEPLTQIFGDPDFDTDRPTPVETIDSFFDVFVEIDARDRHFDTEIVSMQLVSHDPSGLFGDPDFGEIFGDPDFDPLFGDPDFPVDRPAPAVAIDSFFDVFVEIDARDRHFDTEIVSMDLRVSNLEDTQTQASTTAVFIKIGDIKGESVESSHEDWSDLLSCNQGQSVPEPSGQSRQRASVSLGDVVCVKELDKASPKIAEAVLTGEVFPKVAIHFTASYGDAGLRLVYYAYELTNVRVTSYNIGGSGQGDDVPIETFSLNFEEIKVTYTERDSEGKSKGNVEYTWKVEEGES